MQKKKIKSQFPELQKICIEAGDNEGLLRLGFAENLEDHTVGVAMYNSQDDPDMVYLFDAEGAKTLAQHLMWMATLAESNPANISIH